MKKLMSLFVFSFFVLASGCNSFEVGKNEVVETGKVLGCKYIEKAEVTLIGLEVEDNHAFTNTCLIPLYLDGGSLLEVGDVIEVLIARDEIAFSNKDVSSFENKGKVVFGELTQYMQPWYKIRNFKTLNTTPSNSQLLEYFK